MEYRIYKNLDGYFVKKEITIFNKKYSYYLRQYHFLNDGLKLIFKWFHGLSFIYLFYILISMFSSLGWIHLHMIFPVIAFISQLVLLFAAEDEYDSERIILFDFKKYSRESEYRIQNKIINLSTERKRKIEEKRIKKNIKAQEKEQKEERKRLLKETSNELVSIIVNEKIIEGQELSDIKKTELRKKKFKNII